MADRTPTDSTHPRPLALVPLLDQDQIATPESVPLTSFIGRTTEIGVVVALLLRPEVRLLTLTGAGGIGKTRLALRVVETVRETSGEASAWVSFAAVHDPELLLPAIAQSLDVPHAAGESLLEQIRAYLQERRLLLVLDNAEHLVDAVASLATGLLASCPGLTVVATSRVRLNISGEQVVPMLPLDQDSASALFADRGAAVNPTFSFTPDNASVIDTICDRLPLAIELAAARTNVLPPPALLARLEHRLPLLTGGPRDAPDRQRDMRAAIAWSHDLLTDDERMLFRRLGVFAGGFTLQAAQAVAGPELDAFAGISALVAASLVNSTVGYAEEPRFGMLETIREYALEQLLASGENAAVRDAHAAWCIDLAEVALPYWTSPDQRSWMDRCETEHDNLRAALAWLAGPPHSPGAVRLIGALWFFWFAHSHWVEGGRWLEHGLAWSDGDRTLPRIRVLIGAAALALMSGDATRSLAWGKEALDLGRATDERDLVWTGDAPLVGLGAAAFALGDDDLALQYNDAALALCRRLENTIPSAAATASVVLCNMGVYAWIHQDLARATHLAEEALAIQEDLGFAWGAADSLWLLARIAERSGDTGRAVALCRRSLAFAMESRDLLQVSQVLDCLVLVAADAGHYHQAVPIMSAAQRLHEVLGNHLAQQDQERMDKALARARRQLGAVAFEAAWAAGRAYSLGEAVAAALQIDEPKATPAAGPDQMGLTRREREVLRLLAEGRSNRAIAEMLSLSERTIENYVLHVLTKLNLESRTAAAVFAVRHGLD